MNIPDTINTPALLEIMNIAYQIQNTIVPLHILK